MIQKDNIWRDIDMTTIEEKMTKKIVERGLETYMEGH